MTNIPSTDASVLGREAAIELVGRPERRLIRSGGSARHVEFEIRVRRPVEQQERTPVRLALVLDRSGSMESGKLEMAKRAALLVLDRLDPRDTVAAVAFDDQVDILSAATPATPETKDRLRAAINRLQPRASTALHEGWLTGCKALIDDPTFSTGLLARCFLLTDGLANAGITDPEQIASDAAGLRARAGIGTSTFGIGADYDEGLLGPMAVAGGGQFYHLREGAEIISTFAGELGDLLATVAAHVRLELEAGPGVKPEMVSQYVLQPLDAANTWGADLGDLIGGEERHVVVRLRFPRHVAADACEVRARVRWIADGTDWETSWEPMSFVYADRSACDAELYEPDPMHWVGLHHADRARLDSAALSNQGEMQKARRRLKEVAKRIAVYAGSDADLIRAIEELRALEATLAEAPLGAMMAKEVAYQSIRATSSRPDYRGQP